MYINECLKAIPLVVMFLKGKRCNETYMSKKVHKNINTMTLSQLSFRNPRVGPCTAAGRIDDVHLEINVEGRCLSLKLVNFTIT